MLSYLNGNIKAIFDHSAILEVNNIGYRVFLNESTLLKLSTGSTLEVYCHQSFSDYGSTIFGFTSLDKLTFFEQLITVSGVGPKLAMNILESPIETLTHAILNRDIAMLVEFPGIGKKTAERLCVELQEKLRQYKFQNQVNKESENNLSNSDEVSKIHKTPLCNEDAYDALQSLGYSRLEAHRMISTVSINVIETEAIVREALKSKKSS